MSSKNMSKTWDGTFIKNNMYIYIYAIKWSGLDYNICRLIIVFFNGKHHECGQILI